MSKPRMTTRRWILAVAIAAALLESYREFKLSSQYRIKASKHKILSGEGALHGSGRAAGMYAYFIPNSKLVVYHTEMRRKYESAARHPWLPIEPDPPEPE